MVKARKYTDDGLLNYLKLFYEDFSKLLHVWRITGNFIDEDYLYIGIGNSYTLYVDNMKKYEITERFNNFYD